MKLLQLLQLHFLPRSTDAALLVLRLWLGLSLVLLHGWSKLTGFSALSGKFPDPLGVGSSLSLTMAVFGEVVCSLLLVLGLFTRGASVALAITMAVAFFLVHKGALSGPQSGELAFVYLAGFVVLFIAGAGRFSVDARLGGRASG